MKRAIGFSLILVTLAGPAWARSLDKNETWAPSVYHNSPGAPELRALINDGSFENGPPPTSAWTEVSNYPCEWIGEWAGQWYVSAFDGAFDLWVGGYCYDEGSGQLLPATTSATQNVAIPAGNPILSFYYIALRPDSDDDPTDDHAYVAIDGIEVWSLPLSRASDTYPNWVGPIEVSLAAYAGTAVDLTFGGLSGGEVTGNLRFDFIEFKDGPVPTIQTTWGSVKALYK